MIYRIRKRIDGDKLIMPILFLLAPFISFIVSAFRPMKRYYQVMIILFYALFGYYRKLEEASDAAHWTYVMIDMQNDGYESLEMLALGYSYFNIGYLLFLYFFSNIYYTAVIWSVVFALTAIAFLYLYKLQFRKEFYTNISIRNTVLFLLFIGYIPFNSYGVKFWLAYLIFMIGYFISLNDKRIVGTIIVLISALFHYSLLYLILLYFFAQITLERNIIFKTFSIVVIISVVYVGNIFLDVGFLEEKLNSYLSGSKIEERSLWIVADRFMTSIMSIIVIVYTYYRKIKVKDIEQLRYFLLVFGLGLIPLVNTLDGLDRYSRAFSCLTLLYIIRLRANRIYFPEVLNIGVIVIYSWHVVVNFILRKGEVGFEIFYQPCFEFFSNGPMSVFINP